MNEGYKQASEISRNLILTFIFGIIIGMVIGWGARSTIAGPAPADSPTERNVAQDTSAVETPAPESPPPPAPVEAPTPEPAITPAAEKAPEVATPPFDPDVDGLWPAAHLFTGIKGTIADVDTVEWLNEFKPGGVVLGPENVIDPLQLATLVLQIKKAVGLGTKVTDPPFIVYEDPEHPLPRILALDGDGSEAGTLLEASAAQAREALKQGVGVFLGPSLDMFSPGVSEARLEAASFGSTAEAVSGPGLAYVNQLIAAGLMPVAREFPGAGLAVKAEDGTWHIPADQMDALAAAMEPFKAGMDMGIPGILVGQMAVPGIDTERPKRPAALSPRLLQLLVRQDWKYNGVLIAGDITRHPMTRDLPRDEIALKSLFSGCDAVILKDANRADLRAIGDTFVRLAKRSDFPSAQFEASRQRLKDWLGRLGTPIAAPAQPPVAVVAEAPPAPVETPAPVTAEMPSAPVEDTAVPKPEAAPAPAPDPAALPAPATAAPPAPAEAPVPEAATPAATPELVSPPVAEIPAIPVAPEPVPAPEAHPAIPAEHIIVKGDSLNALAKRYGIPVADLRAWNGMESDVIKIGQVLKLQAPAAEDDPAAKSAPEAEPAPAVTSPPVPEPAPSEPAHSAEAVAAEGNTPVEAPEGSVPVEPASGAPPAEVTSPTEPARVPQPPDTDKREHTVASGETLGTIAGMYGVAVADIQGWNGLDPGETVINAGASLVVYLPVATPEAPASAPASEAAPTPAADNAAPPKNAEPEVTVAAEPAPGTFEIYVVAQGDNLRRIAQRFGTTQQKLVEMNGLKSADLVQIGWKLKVPKQAAAPVSGSTP